MSLWAGFPIPKGTQARPQERGAKRTCAARSSASLRCACARADARASLARKILPLSTLRLACAGSAGQLGRLGH